jgi:hypothetical protein
MAIVDKLLVFLASPGDVQDERRAVHEVIDEVNRTVAAATEIVLQVVGWESDSTYALVYRVIVPRIKQGPRRLSPGESSTFGRADTAA